MYVPPDLHALLAKIRGVAVCAALGWFAGVAPAHAADALNGKALFLNGPRSGGVSCASCHGTSPADNVNGILVAANSPATINAAFAANLGGMGQLFNGRFTQAEIADLAAFIGNPNVTAAAPVATLSPASLTFNGTTLGQSSGPLTATLSNPGNAVLTLGAISLVGTAASDYSMTGGSCVAGGAVAPSAGCTIQVNFAPGAAGVRTAAILISHNAAGALSTLALSGTGNPAPQATIGVSATNLNFGALLTGVKSAAQTLTVSNSGQAALAFNGIALSGANPAVFTLGGTCAVAAPVASGASCTLTVQALPTAGGAFSANLVIGSNAANGTATVALAGSGTTPTPAVTANPGTIAFGSQTLGTGAVTQTVTLTNTGNVVLNFSSILVTGAASVTIGSSATCGATLAPAASCVVPLVFAPTAAGAVTATLAVASNAAPLQVAVSGAGTTAVVAKPTLSDSGTVAFADTQIGKSAAVHTTTLQNPSTVALKIATLVLSGAQAGDFALGGTCAVNATLSPASSCTITSAFTPTAAGARSASLLVVSDSGAQLGLSLSGTGIAIVTATPTLTVQPPAFDFGAAVIGAAASLKRFVLTNTGSAAVTIGSAAYTGPYSAALDATGCAPPPFVLKAGGTCDLVVQYKPTTAGTNTGNVVLQASDSAASWTIALSGQASAAVTATPPATGAQAQAQNQGGGGCSALRGGDDPMLALLVLLAIGVLVRRRYTGARTAP